MHQKEAIKFGSDIGNNGALPLNSACLEYLNVLSNVLLH